MSALRYEDEDRLLSVEDAAGLLQISEYTIREWARDGKIPAMRMGRYWRFRKSSLDAWINDQERPVR